MKGRLAASHISKPHDCAEQGCTLITLLGLAEGHAEGKEEGAAVGDEVGATVGTYRAGYTRSFR